MIARRLQLRGRARATLAVVALLCAGAGAGAGTGVADEAARGDLALVEARVRGQARGVMEIRRAGGELLLPLDELAAVLDLQVERIASDAGERARLLTPLGPLDVPADELRAVRGRTYLRAGYVRDALRAAVAFDEREYAVAIDPVWRDAGGAGRGPGGSGGPGGNGSTGGVPGADAHPPQASLAGLRAAVDHLRFGDDASTFGGLQLAGRLAEGVWTVVAEDSTDAAWNLREYHWYRRIDRAHVLAGRERVQLHPGLGDFDLAGVQLGWTDDPQAQAAPLTYGANVLFPRRGRPLETVAGASRPGNFVQLRVDGRVLDTRQVGFNGKYVFDRVPLPSRQAAEIEVLIFDPSNLRIPVEVRRSRLAASEYLLPRGVQSHMGGLGRAGRFAEGFAASAEGLPNGWGGYYQGRAGFSDRFTGEVAVQHVGERTQAYAGAVARLAPTWVASAGLLRARDRTGWAFDLQGYAGRWELLASSGRTPSALGAVETDDPVRDDRIDVAWRPRDGLRLALVARAREDGIRDVEFVLPALTWRPNRDWYLDARPDVDGEYLASVSWRAREQTRLRYFRSRTSTFELTHALTERWSIGWSNEFERIEPRHTLFAGRAQTTRVGHVYGRAGVTTSGDRWGWTATLSAPVAPGVVARAEYHSLPLLTPDGEDRGRLLLNVVTDLSQSGGRFVPAHSQNFRRELGGIAGRVGLDHRSRLYAGVEPDDYDLSGIRVLVDGQVRTRTDASGRFFVGSLDEGVYAVELDPEGLPIELTPQRTRLTARVSAGAATRVDFPVALQYGMAGRVVDADGRPVSGVYVELRRVRGDRIAGAWTDAFGLYRLDAVTPGSYALRALRDGRTIARRAVTLHDGFLFDQDLAVPPFYTPPAPEPAGAS